MMIQTIKNNFALIAAGVVLLLASLMLPMAVGAQDTSLDIQNDTKCGSNIDGLSSTSCDSNVSCAGNEIQDVIKTVISVFSAVFGSVSVIIIIIVGFRYITSGGSSVILSGSKTT